LTINLGAIKFNWKGAYNSSTTYAVDDVVSSGGNSYVCIQAHSNQAVGNATAYWNIMSSAGTNGTNGTNGTDVGTTITTQGDILYRDGSGLQRLPKGTASQALIMNSGATAPEWGNLSSDFVKLGSNYATGINNSNNIVIDGYFTSAYKTYKLYVTSRMENNWIKFRMNQSGSAVSNSWYRHTADYSRKSSSSETQGTISNWNSDYQVSHSYWSATSDVGACGEYTIFDPLSTTTRCKMHWKGAEQDATYWYRHDHTGYLNDTGAVTGLTFFPNSGDFVEFGWTLYGLKA
jgi:hypothetical protein